MNLLMSKRDRVEAKEESFFASVDDGELQKERNN